jgi:hypothetical protein
MGRIDNREGGAYGAYGTAAAAVAVAICIGLLSSCSVERASSPQPGSTPSSTATGAGSA